jgi:7-cyano-7-deazaguanine synthase
MKKAVILLSGGQDSATCLALATSQGYECHALSFDYGQRLVAEINAAKKVAAYFNAKSHRIVDLRSLGELGKSALTDDDIDVPDYKGDGEIPVTYVPARNTVFLSFALALAETLHANDIFIGVNQVDYSGYPDCRPKYIEAFQKMVNLATKAGVEGNTIKVHTPLIYLNKAQIVELGMKLNVDYRMTVTCYRADVEGRACGQCDSCVLRKKGFEQAHVEDQTIYS